MKRAPHEPGAAPPPSEAERALLRKLDDEKESPSDTLWELAELCKATRQFEKALAYLRRLMVLDLDVDEKATCVLGMGQVMEVAGDFPAAVRYYREALALEPTRRGVSYFINNNLGFSLNVVCDFTGGEIFCRKAIEIDPERPNGHKNLGIALAGQGRYREAAECFVAATDANAADTRALELLIKLREEHPELNLKFRDDFQRREQAIKRARASKIVH